MVEYTPEYSLPYVGGNDYVQNYPATASKPLAERIESQLKTGATNLASALSDITELETKNTALVADLASAVSDISDLETKNTTLETNLASAVSDLEQFKSSMIEAVGFLNAMALQATDKRTATIVSEYSANNSEKFIITRIGPVVTIEGSLKSTMNVESANHYLPAIQLPPWARPPSGRTNFAFLTGVYTWDTKEYFTSYGIVVGYDVQFAGPFDLGDTVRGSVTFITDRDINTTQTDDGNPAALEEKVDNDE